MRIDLNAPVTKELLQRSLCGFWSWWCSELATIMPRRLSKWLGVVFSDPLVRQTDGAWHVAWPQLGLTATPMRDAEQLAAIFREKRVPRFGNRAIVEVARHEIVLRTFPVPSAAVNRLRSAIELQLDRLSPFAPKDVLFACHAGEPLEDGSIEAIVAIVPKTQVRRYFKTLREYQIVPQHFRVAGTDLIIEDNAQSGWRNIKNVNFALATVAAALWIASALLVGPSRTSELNKAMEHLDQLRKSAGPAIALQHQVSNLTRALSEIAPVAAAPRSLDTLLDLTNALPKEVELTELSISGSRIQATGLSYSPKIVPRVLTRGGRFRIVHFTTGATRWSHLRTFTVMVMAARQQQELPSHGH